MSEKTAEEKLRQELEGGLTQEKNSEPKIKPKPLRAKPKINSRRSEFPDNVNGIIDTFMDDFERKIERSINSSNIPQEHQEKSKTPKKSSTLRPKKTPKPETVIPPEPKIKHHETPVILEAEPLPDESIPEVKPAAPDEPVVIEPEVLPEVLPAASEPELPQEDTIPIVEAEPLEDVLPVVVQEPETPETLQELPASEPEILPETEAIQEEAPSVIDIDAEELPEAEPVITEPEPPEFPEIPVLEAESESESLPDIPVITPENDEDDSDDFIDFTEGFIPDETEEQSEITPPEPESEPDAQEDEQEDSNKLPEFQEAELIEGPGMEDTFADIPEETEETEEFEADNAVDAESFDDEITDGLNDEPLDEEPAQLETDAFTPAADVVVNVDDVLPQISDADESDTDTDYSNDPEAEPVPVTVTMPESTKTAEDKLMADIAEAMTGNPLTLDSKDAQAPYTLPENFFTEENSGSSQSAEDKLKANIAQALSESPIAAAQSNSHQDFEQDINPFDEISLPDTLMPQNDEEQEQEINTDDVPPDDEAETQDDEPFDITSVPETENENDIDTADETETAEDPFALSEENFDEPEQFEPVEVSSEAETDDIIDEQPEVEPETETLTNEDPFETEAAPDAEPEPELPPEEPEQPLVLEEDNTETETQSVHDDFADLPFSLGDDDETDETPQEIPQIHEEPANEIESLTQEVAAARQENQIIQKEEEPVNNMPEETLLDDLTPENIEPENENHDDWDVNSLGELGAAATFSDDAPDEFHSVPETVTEIITQPESGAFHNPEEDHKEKTMNIREKLASRKKAASDDSPAKKKSSSGGGFLLPLLMGLTLIVGSLILWQLMQLSDKITSLAMNSSGFESVPVHETAPSYEYAIDFILDPNLNERMSQRGREGWQVVGSRRTQDSTSGQYGYELIFMRRILGR